MRAALVSPDANAGTLEVGVEIKPDRVRSLATKTLCCSFCRAELGQGRVVTVPESGAHSQRVLIRSFCSARCRDCVLALAALHPSPLASKAFLTKRLLLTDRLLDLWRRGEGPDPAAVLRAAESASSGLTIAPAL
jgi:hypothetical protein